MARDLTPQPVADLPTDKDTTVRVDANLVGDSEATDIKVRRIERAPADCFEFAVQETLFQRDRLRLRISHRGCKDQAGLAKLAVSKWIAGHLLRASMQVRVSP